MNDKIKMIKNDDPYSICTICKCDNHYSSLYEIRMQAHFNTSFTFNICEKCFEELILQHNELNKEN